jgi:hypothetical protein
MLIRPYILETCNWRWTPRLYGKQRIATNNSTAQ